MWKKNNRYHHRRFGNGFRGRPVKTVPKQALLALIAKSKLEKPGISAPDISSVRVHRFSEYPLHPTLLENIRIKGFETLTPIQEKVIPIILSYRDVIGMSNTGTGKTAAFLIPLIQKITIDRAQRVLIIAPTRELVIQIHKELRDLSRGLSIRNAMLIGGASQWRQAQDVRQDPHVVIATPGRLKDFIVTRRLRLSAFRNVVLDEADRMVDIGFINEIKYFISLLPKERQSLFFSATISGKVGEILTDFVHDPVEVSAASQPVTEMIIQDIIKISDNKSKADTLHDILKQKEFEKVLVFGRTKHGVQKLCDDFAKRGLKTGAIHGNKHQNQRQFVLNQFIRNEIRIMFATDVASRGLDIPDVSHVINYDLPETMDDYIHRIGRTGRANKQGIALTFID